MVIDYIPFWTWFLLFVRFSGVFTSLPGIGGEEVPLSARVPLVIVISAAITMSGARGTLPISLADGMLTVGVEFLLGYLIGVIPTLIISGLGLAGHLSATSIGLNQASIIDPSLGEHVTTLGRIQTLIGVALFLVIDGHHTVIKAAANISTDVGLGMFRPGVGTVELLIQRVAEAFQLGAQISAPIIVVSLISQFILGLVTKFVPQVNIFIMSTPLTILAGLFVFGFTLPEMIRHVDKEFISLQEVFGQLMSF